MKPIVRPHTTRSLISPAGWDINRYGLCVELPISDQDGIMYSYWQPTFRQKLLILFGQCIRLSVIGTTHPPVAIDTED